KPWRKDPNYFKNVYISSLALMKMTLHSSMGGNIEVMGMMIGKIVNQSIVIMDCYSLPVEGTETRVNAQEEGYEYMVNYLSLLKKLKGDLRKENIVGWYHSHPGYGCWLSGIDVATQSLNQTHQDPYLAVVIDPKKTLSQGKVEIGAFRVYPLGYNKKNTRADEFENNGDAVPKNKQEDFGVHSSDYYSLNVTVFKSKIDNHSLDFVL
ncbi:Mov34/MPN/PAD-1 family protein, partial [Ascoidea rubescens DSM 1968]